MLRNGANAWLMYLDVLGTALARRSSHGLTVNILSAMRSRKSGHKETLMADRSWDRPRSSLR